MCSSADSIAAFHNYSKSVFEAIGRKKMSKKYLGMQKVSFQTIELCEGDGENREGRPCLFSCSQLRRI